MLVEVRDERLPLPSPVITPVGVMESVGSVVVELGEGGRRGIGRARCHTDEQAERIIAAVSDVVRSCRIVEQPLEELTWDGWSQTWRRAVEAAGRAELRALCAIDAAMWELAPPPRHGAVQPRALVYWSGFWLGESIDAARREAENSVTLGFDAVKMRCDAGDLASSVARFNAIADQLPDSMGIAIELAESGSVDYVTRLVEEIDAGRVLWIEDPVPATQPQDTASLVAALPVPIAGGEVCWGTSELDAYLAETGLTVPIIDLCCCGGPSALATFLGGPGRRFDTVGVHLDATLTARTVARLEGDHEIYVEVLNWWEQTTPEELRAALAA